MFRKAFFGYSPLAFAGLMACMPLASAESSGSLMDPTRPTGWRAMSDAVVDRQSERPVELRLQGVFSGAGRRSAMISGKRVAVGDSVAGAEVMTIDKNSVTLLLDGELLELAATVSSVKTPVGTTGGSR